MKWASSGVAGRKMGLSVDIFGHLRGNTPILYSAPIGGDADICYN